MTRAIRAAVATGENLYYLAAALANLAASALAAAVRPRALLLVGGDTAYACLRRLAIGRDLPTLRRISAQFRGGT